MKPGNALARGKGYPWQPWPVSVPYQTLCEELQEATVCTSHKVPLLDQRRGANPSIVGKTADQHWLEVNFAQITFSHIDIL